MVVSFRRILCVTVALSAAVFLAPRAPGDTLVFTDGSAWQGTFIQYSNGEFVFQMDDGRVRRPPEAIVQELRMEPRSLAPAAVAPATTAIRPVVPPPSIPQASSADPEALLRIESRLEELRQMLIAMDMRVDDRLTQLLTTFSAESGAIQDHLFANNPVSQILVANDKETTIGRDMAIIGNVVNNGPYAVRDLTVLVELLNQNNWVVASEEQTIQRTIGPRGRANFSVRFASTPSDYASYRITPLLRSRTRDEAGEFFPPPGIR